MSQQLSPQEVSIKNIQRRRVRSDTQNRDYICKCGKSYLSYPALYTHIKQKHPEEISELKKAGGITKPQTADLPRGRPRVVKEVAEKEEELIEYSALSITELLIVELVEIFKEMNEFRNRLSIQVDNNVLEHKDIREELKQFNLPVDYLIQENLKLPQKSASMKELAVYFLTILQKHFSAYVYARLVIYFHLFLICYEREESKEKVGTEFLKSFINEFYKEQKERINVKVWDEKPKILQKVFVAFGNWMHTYGYVKHGIEMQ